MTQCLRAEDRSAFDTASDHILASELRPAGSLDLLELDAAPHGTLGSFSTAPEKLSAEKSLACRPVPRN